MGLEHVTGKISEVKYLHTTHLPALYLFIYFNFNHPFYSLFLFQGYGDAVGREKQ